ncbi:MAG TPA: hypothetical protein VK066_20730 [Chloroflexota bacterium]|nr:hypothetical protein [Chloroflexota bacterium]
MPSMLLPRRGAHDGYYVVCPRHGPVTVASGKLQLCPYCAHARPVPKRRKAETGEQTRFDEPQRTESADAPPRAPPAFRTRAP